MGDSRWDGYHGRYCGCFKLTKFDGREMMSQKIEWKYTGSKFLADEWEANAGLVKIRITQSFRGASSYRFFIDYGFGAFEIIVSENFIVETEHQAKSIMQTLILSIRA